MKWFRHTGKEDDATPLFIQLKKQRYVWHSLVQLSLAFPLSATQVQDVARIPFTKEPNQCMTITFTPRDVTVLPSGSTVCGVAPQVPGSTGVPAVVLSWTRTAVWELVVLVPGMPGVQKHKLIQTEIWERISILSNLKKCGQQMVRGVSVWVPAVVLSCTRTAVWELVVRVVCVPGFETPQFQVVGFICSRRQARTRDNWWPSRHSGNKKPTNFHIFNVQTRDNTKVLVVWQEQKKAPRIFDLKRKFSFCATVLQHWSRPLCLDSQIKFWTCSWELTGAVAGSPTSGTAGPWSSHSRNPCTPSLSSSVCTTMPLNVYHNKKCQRYTLHKTFSSWSKIRFSWLNRYRVRPAMLK